MAGHRSVVRRNPGGRKIGGSVFPTNRLSGREVLTAAERLVRASGKKLNIADARQEILKRQAEREKRLKKRA